MNEDTYYTCASIDSTKMDRTKGEDFTPNTWESSELVQIG